VIISRSILLGTSNVSGKIYIANQKTILRSITFLPLQNRAVYEIMWINILERGISHMTISRMRIASWIPKATNMNSEYEYVILIALPLQRWLHEHASTLCYTYIACQVYSTYPPTQYYHHQLKPEAEEYML
jgi:hypothetical protein